MIELLSPAGDFERLRFALRYGADAVYIGGKNFSLRANAINFTNEELKKAVDYAHNLNKKVYVTVNIIPHDDDINNNLENYLKYLDQIKVDAIIVSDFYIMNLWKQLKLNMELHISTQASTLNKETALFYKEFGAKRVVLARETSEKDIKEIKDYTSLDLEAFIHGAMCTSISGRCIMSNYATNRDANRGGCAQVCRWNFDLYNNNNIISNNYQMCPMDLNMCIYIKDMINAGVNSFKIEGRMRSIYYISTVIYSYRKIIDHILNNTLNDKIINYYLKILNRCANRESKPQFFKELPTYKEQYYNGNKEISNQDFLGVVLENNNGLITLEQRNYFKKGTKVEFISPNFEETEYTIKDIYDENNNPIEEANHAQMIVKFKTDIDLTKDDIMRLKVIDKED